MNARQDKTEQLLEQLQQGQADTNTRLDNMQAEMDKGFEEMADSFEKVHGDIANLYQNHEKSMDIIKEGLPQIQERYTQLEAVEQTVKSHGDRIFALEQKAANE